MFNKLSRVVFLVATLAAGLSGHATAQPEDAPPSTVTQPPDGTSPADMPETSDSEITRSESEKGESPLPTVTPEVEPPPTTPKPLPEAGNGSLPPHAPPASLTASVPTPDVKPGPTLVVSPHLFARYELRRNYQDVGKTAGRFRDFDGVAYRARVKFTIENLSMGKNSSIEIVLSPQSSGFWTGSGGLADASLDLHEGYLKPHFAGTSWFQLGRFEMAYGDQWLIGPVGWHETGRSFDGARLHLAERRAGGTWFDLFAIALSDGFSPDPMLTANDRIGAGDYYLIGVYTDIGPWLSEGMNVDLYALTHVAPQTDALNPGDGSGPIAREAAAELTAGARLKGGVGPLGYRLEGGLQVGERVAGPSVVDSFAGAVDGELSVSLHEKFRIAAQGFYFTGDDPDTPNKTEGWLDRYSTAHKWVGLSDVTLPRTNYLGGAFHTWIHPTANLTFGTQTHAFARPLPDLRYFGTELDFFLAWKLMPGLTFRTDYDIFLPDSDAFGADAGPVHYLGVELRYAGDAVIGG